MSRAAVLRVLIGAVALAATGCLDNSILKPPVFLCPDGNCPEGLVCGADAVCLQATTDAGPSDAGPPDAGPPDAGVPDAGPPDAGAPDSGPADAGTFDAGPAITSVAAEASANTLAGSTVVRQGAGAVTFDIVGESLGAARSVTVGGGAANLFGVSDNLLQVGTIIDHGLAPGPLPVAVTLAGGSTITADSPPSVSFITVGPTGVDAPGGDGSSLHPFRSLTQALLVAGASGTTGQGDTVLLSNGTYDQIHGESWPTANALMGGGNPGFATKSNLPSQITIVGESQAHTILSGAGTSISAFFEPTALIPAGSGSLVQHLTIDGFAFGYVANSGSNALDDVVIQHSSQQGILLWGDGSTTISLSVTGNSAVVDGGIDGIFVRHATLTMDGGALIGNAEFGLCLQDEAAASLSSVEISNNGTGVYAGANGANGQTFTLDSCHIHDNVAAGVEAHSNAGSYHTVYINNSEIASNEAGIYLQAQFQGALSTTAMVVDGGIIHDNTNDGVLVQAGLWHLTTLDLEGTILQNNPGSGVELYPDDATGGPAGGGSSFTLRNVTSMGNAYGVRFEGSPLLADLGAADGGGVNVLANNSQYQLSDERPQDAGVVIDASGAVLAVDGGTWPKGTPQTGPISQPPAFQILNRNNAIQF